MKGVGSGASPKSNRVRDYDGGSGGEKEVMSFVDESGLATGSEFVAEEHIAVGHTSWDVFLLGLRGIRRIAFVVFCVLGVLYALYRGYYYFFLGFIVFCPYFVLLMRVLFKFMRQRTIIIEYDDVSGTMTPYGIGEDRLALLPLDVRDGFMFRRTKLGEPVLCTYSVDDVPIMIADTNRVSTSDVHWNFNFIKKMTAESRALWRAYRDSQADGVVKKLKNQIEYAVKVNEGLLGPVLSPEADKIETPVEPSARDVVDLRDEIRRIKAEGGENE